MSFSNDVKTTLLQIIDDMAANSADYVKNPGTDFSRKRKLDFASLLHLLISMEAGTVRDELMEYFSYNESTATNSAFFQQRAKLSQSALPHLFHAFNNAYPCSLYKGKYQLLAADGSSFTYTRTPSDTDSYFPPNEKTTNGYNQVHVIPLFDITNKRFTDCVVQPIRKKNEFQALCQLIDKHQPQIQSIPIFIADRGFHSLNVFAHAIEHKYFFLIRATDVKMRRLIGKDLPENKDSFDQQITRFLTRTQSKKKRQHPECPDQYKYICPNVAFDYINSKELNEYAITLRILRFQISEDGYENIITNLPATEFSMEEIKTLYHMRWGIETSFRELKHVLGTMNFHSKRREYIVMEIWARLLLYNFCSIITNHVCINRKGKKYTLQVNFSVAYKACHYLLRLHNGGAPPDIESLIGKNALPIRPNRTYARQHRFRNPASFTYRYK